MENTSDAGGARGRLDGGGVALAVLAGLVGGRKSAAAGWA